MVSLFLYIQEPLEAINLLLNLITGDDEEPVDAVTAVYLLGSILNRLNSTDNRDQFNEVRCYLRIQNTFLSCRFISFTQAFIRVGSAITQLDIIGRERVKF